MANIPKKVVERFTRSTVRFQKVLQIAKDRDVNESDTVSILNDILGEVLGYDKYLEVTSEFAIRSTYCDLAIRVDDKVQFLVEAKAIGIGLKDIHMKQACDYGANHGVPWVILTNGITWNIYKIRFEQPINYDLVCTFDFLALNIRNEKDQECLFMLSKEGLAKKAREEYYEKVQSLNRYVIGNLIIGESVLGLLRRELKQLAGGMKIEIPEIENIVRNEVLKREIVEGDEAEAAKTRLNKFYKKKLLSRKTKKESVPQPISISEPTNESVTEKLLREAKEE
ncbi:MAG: type I restriction enzyme HsdR N-terminal domain-containing protein [Candidatus Hydrogenedentes bacterium]|nr:type I restriction enzyme HsdR N-terminal domain-containing protein [Candidatus Hydrogenedentota bacterium]